MITKKVVENIAIASISDNLKLNVLNAEECKKCTNCNVKRL